MCPVLDTGVDGPLLAEICRLQLDMMLVVVDTERTLEQRLRSIPSHSDSRPAGGCPSPLSRADQGPASEDLVLMSLYRFTLAQRSICADVLHPGILCQDIVVRLEF